MIDKNALRIERKSITEISAHQDAIEELRKLIRNTGYAGMMEHYQEKIKEHEAEILRLRKSKE